MLTDLIIKNFAIIDRLHVTFGPGFNVLTGETGAGKSIVIDAVGLLLGERAHPDLVRSGEAEATVEALFDLSGQPELAAELETAGFEAGQELVVKRVVSRAGKNRVFINGSLATLAVLAPFAERLMVIYGQHAHQHLQRRDNHLALLDRFAGLGEELRRYRQRFAEVQELERRLDSLAEAERERQQRLDLLVFQSRELHEAQLRPGEDEELEAERLLLQNAEKLAAATGGGYQVLYGGDGAVCERLGGLAEELAGLSKVDPHLGQLAETLQGALYAVEDVALELRGHAEKVSFEPGRQQEVEDRLALLAALRRKYAPTVDGVLEVLAEVDRELEVLGDVDAARQSLETQLDEARALLEETGGVISGRRLEAARQLQLAVEGELSDLAMGKARFSVRLKTLEAPGPRGMEGGEFYLAANPGEEPKPLARIASGGELSRIMLALRRAAPDGGTRSTLVFDEVDAGIGGEAATAVGEKLRGVAAGAQVLCITHLPQVAAFADRHYRVEKNEQQGRTMTAVRELEAEERIGEMARMLGGAKVTEQALAHARELLDVSRAERQRGGDTRTVAGGGEL